MSKYKYENKLSGRFLQKITSQGLLLTVSCLLITANCLFTACQPNASILNSKANDSSSANTAPTVYSFEYDMQTMKNADFDFIYVMRRKDGGTMSDDDRKYVKMNSPSETNRFILSDENKAVIAGSKYKFAAENLMALESRFKIENFSKPDSETGGANQNTNQNTNTNSGVNQ